MLTLMKGWGQGWQWAGLRDPRTVGFDGEIQVGQSLAFLGQYTAKSGTPYFHLYVFEAFKAEERQMQVLENERGIRRWLEDGPENLKLVADAARTWAAKATHPRAQVQPEFQRTLEDGKILKLEALTLPAKWPFCFWDAMGEPTEGLPGINSINGDPTKNLVASVHVTGPRTEWKSAHSPMGENNIPMEYTDWQTTELPANSNSVDVGVLVGPWTKIGELKTGESVTIDDVNYGIDQPYPYADQRFLVHFRISGVTSDEICLTAVGPEDKELSGGYAKTIIFDKSAGGAKSETQPNFYGFAYKQVKYFRLWKRKREWVTFSNFATNPKTKPQTFVKHEDALSIGSESKTSGEKEGSGRKARAAPAVGGDGSRF